MTKVICKECGRSVPAGICCDACGAQLASNALDSSASTSENPPVTRELPDFEPPSQHFVSSEIKLLYDITEFSVVGLEQAFSFTLQAGSNRLSNVCVYAEHQSASGNRIVGKSKELWRLPAGQERKVSIAYRSGPPGVAVYNFYVVFRSEDELCCMESDERRVPVYPPEMGARDAIQNLSISIKNEISNVSGHANDYQINGALGDLHDLMGRVDPEDNIKSVIKQIAECGSYVALQLFDSNWRPASAAKRALAPLPIPETLAGRPPAEGRDGLTLRYDGRLIHLFSAAAGFDIGRSRDSQVVTRHIGADGSVAIEANQKISRLHCHIERSGDCLRIQDGSAWGTWINGAKLSGCSEVQGSSFVLMLAGDSEREPGAFGLKCRLWSCSHDQQRECRLTTCDKKRAMASMILQRGDQHHESHVGLWHCCDLRSVAEQLAGMIVWQQDGGFGYAIGDDAGWLKPGMRLDVGGTLVEVTARAPLGCAG